MPLTRRTFSALLASAAAAPRAALSENLDRCAFYSGVGGQLTHYEVDFAGVHYRLSGASIAPKPVQPDLPMWIGGSSEAAIRRTARFGTGWQAGAETPDQVAPVIAAITPHM